MRCSNCNSENSDTAKFCKKCGNPLTGKTMDHESVINSISGNKNKSSDDNTTKIIIIALVIIAVVLAGAFIYIFAFGGSSADDASNANSNSAASNTSQVDSDTNDEKTATQSTPSQPSTSSMRIKSGSFSTGSAEEDKTYAQIYVGTEYSGQSVIVQIFYSRDGNSLNHGNMVPANVHSDGYLYITSADAYHYYPDYATIKLYDSNSNLLDTQSVSLSPTSGTQTF